MRSRGAASSNNSACALPSWKPNEVIEQVPSLTLHNGKHGYQCGIPPRVMVLDKEPRVECKTCGATLSAIGVLREYARGERNFCYTLTHLRKELRDLTTEIAKLKALRLRLRGEARKLLPEPSTRPGVRKWIRDQVANEQLDRVLAHEPDPP